MALRWTERGQFVLGDLLTEQGDRRFGNLTEHGQGVLPQVLTHLAAAGLSASGVVTASGHWSGTVSGGASASGSGTVAASALILGSVTGGASLSGSGTIVASGQTPAIHSAAASLSGEGAVAGAGVNYKAAAATVEGAGTLTIAAMRLVFGAAAGSGSGTATGAGRLHAVGRAVGAGIGTANLFVGYVVTGRARPGQRQLEFLFYKVDRRGLYLGDLTTYVRSGSVKMDQDLDVKFQGQFVLTEVPDLNFLADYLMPVVRVTEAGVATDYELPIFRLGWPKRSHDPMVSTWTVDAYDLTIHLLEDVFEEPHTVAAGADPIIGARAVAESAGFPADLINFPVVTAALAADVSWGVGEKKYRAVADLLDAAGCWSPWMERGYLTSAVRKSLADLAPAAVYRTDADSFVLPPVQVETDVTGFANKVVVRVQNPDLPEPLSSFYLNENPESPVSTVSLGGRVISKVIDAKNLQTQTEVDAYARLMCEQAASVYLKGTLPTGLDPARRIHEAYTVEVGDNGSILSGKWWCKGWDMPLAVGGVMTHQIARVEAV